SRCFCFCKANIRERHDTNTAVRFALVHSIRELLRYSYQLSFLQFQLSSIICVRLSIVDGFCNGRQRWLKKVRYR
ncbi:unnamed protein product, partial [Haemonchus placei]|uniref:Ovule protein n=1 Tax=Haemonchus placei TaxID=6290 RepID=A0A0N4X3X9_HAEPC